jgi:CheY-like chemotaxis protein
MAEKGTVGGILLVDDDPNFVDLISEALEKTGVDYQPGFGEEKINQSVEFSQRDLYRCPDFHPHLVDLGGNHGLDLEVTSLSL